MSKCSLYRVASRSLFCSAILIAVFVLTYRLSSAAASDEGLKNWHTLGDATWRIESGDIIGTSKPGSKGGWLISNGSYQDVGLTTSFRCSAECNTGVLLRAEKTAMGLKGVYLSLSNGDIATYRVNLDAQGHETQRNKLRPGGGQMRIAPPPHDVPETPRRAPNALSAPSGTTLPIAPRPEPSLHEGQWNQLEIALDANIIRPFLNEGGPIAGGVADAGAGSYGPVALYVGAGEVRFKDLCLTDLQRKVIPLERTSERFRLQRLNEFYYSWSAASADINRDGILDVVAGPYYYLGPDYTVSHEIYLAQTTNPSTEYPNASMVNFAYDFTGDGWPDVLNIGAIGQPAHLYVNPRGESRRWNEFDVVPKADKEIALVKDVDGDGKPELVYGGDGYLRYAGPNPSNPTGPWIVHTISERGPWGAGHGLGVGDINGDGRNDIVETYGWWEQPAKDSNQKLWTYHPEAFGRWTGRASPGGAEIGIYDVNGDGLNDVVTILQAHGYGLAWFEQKRTKEGKISFVQHMIMDNPSTKNAGDVTFSEPHGSTFADVDGDGIPDLIVGKRYWSHRDDFTDPDPYGPPVLYWYRTVRNAKVPGGAEFVPHLIHNRSGAGNELWATDLNKDGAMDIVTSTDRGTFIFWGKHLSNKNVSALKKH